MSLENLKSSRFNLIFVFVGFNVVLFTLLRLILFFRSIGYFDNPFSFLWVFPVGLLYDLTFNLYFNLLFAILLLLIPNGVYRSRIFKWLIFFFFTLFVFLVYFMVVGEWLFWDEFNVRFNFIAVDYLIYTREVVANIYQSYPVIKILIVLFLLSVGTVYFLRKQISYALLIEEPFKRRLKYFSAYLLITLLAFLFIGQGLRNFPENNYLKELASNGPYQFVASFKDNELDYCRFYPVLDNRKMSQRLKKNLGIDPLKGGLFDIKRKVQGKQPEKRLNVILISIESLSARFLKRFGNKQNLTPFFDSLCDKSLFFTNFYATGTRTTRGLEAITLSIPPTPGRSIVKRPDNAHIYNLGKVFEDKGYYVAFCYGGRGFFDNMNAFFSGCGYHIIDQNDFDKSEITFENAWGVCDEDLLNKVIKVADKKNNEGQRFFLHVMTTSNHRPYTYPKGKIDIPSGTGRIGAVKYTDYAFREFFEKVKSKPWFENTVFVITADHCASSSGKIGLPLKKYHIPLWVYAPGFIKPQVVKKLSSQIDIAPTLLSLLGFGYESCFFGEDILSDNFKERAFISNYEKLGLYENNELAILSPVKKFEVFKDPLGNITKIDVGIDDPIVQDAISYYNGSYYIFKRRMDRY